MTRPAEIVAALIGLRLGVEAALLALNRLEARRCAASPPPETAGVLDGPTFQRSVAYTLARNRFGFVTIAADAAILSLGLFSGVLPRLYLRMAAWGPPGAAWTGALFLLAAGALLTLPTLPFDAWETFRLEAGFGFNQATVGLWMADKIKGAVLAFVVGFPLLWALLEIVQRAGPSWWLWGFGLVLAFQLAAFVLYPRLILPLFNRLSPLPDGELRDRLFRLGDRTGFRARSIQVIDGSKRSGHSNAFFTGFGRFRRIVLFDTLVSQLSPVELEAVLAHEIGHYRRGHVPQRLVLSSVLLFAGFAAVAWLARAPWFDASFGYPPGSMAASFLLFALLSGLVGFWFSPLSSLLSRRHEYQADAFAREAMGGAAPLVAALRRLAETNLSNLAPHPCFSAFYYSHPTLVERERALARAD